MLAVQGVPTVPNEPNVVESVARKDGPILITLKKKREEEARVEISAKKTKVESGPSVSENVSKFAAVDPFIDAENKEIARLEKLMGIKGG